MKKVAKVHSDNTVLKLPKKAVVNGSSSRTATPQEGNRKSWLIPVILGLAAMFALLLVVSVVAGAIVIASGALRPSMTGNQNLITVTDMTVKKDEFQKTTLKLNIIINFQTRDPVRFELISPKGNPQFIAVNGDHYIAYVYQPGTYELVARNQFTNAVIATTKIDVAD